MNTVHLHLMLTHVPVLGTVFALLLLGLGLVRRSEELKKSALWAFALFAAFAIPVFLTGEPAEEVAERLPGVSKAAIETHEDTAKIAFGLVLSLGVIALGGLAFLRKRQMPKWFAVSLFAWAVATSGLLAWAANLGGKVRHTEIVTRAVLPTHAASSERD